MPKQTKLKTTVFRKTNFKRNGKPQSRLRNLNTGRFVSLEGKKRNVKGYWKLVNEVKTNKEITGKTKKERLEQSRRYIKVYVKKRNTIRRKEGQKLISWKAVRTSLHSRKWRIKGGLPEPYEDEMDEEYNYL